MYKTNETTSIFHEIKKLLFPATEEMKKEEIKTRKELDKARGKLLMSNPNEVQFIADASSYEYILEKYNSLEIVQKGFVPKKSNSRDVASLLRHANRLVPKVTYR